MKKETDSLENLMAENHQNSPELSSTDKWKTMEFLKMDVATLDRLQIDLINHLEQLRVIDYHFRHCHELKDSSSSSFLLDLVAIFLIESQKALDDITKKLDEEVVNFDSIYISSIKLKGSSGFLGACRLRAACSQFGLAMDKKSKEGCFEALRLIKDEHKIVSDQFNIVVKIEQELVSRADK